MEEEFDMDIKILKVVEHKDQLRVEVEHAYGQESFGLSLSDKFLDPYTDKPRWMGSVKKFLKKKYAPDKKIEKELHPELINQVIRLSEIKTGVIVGFKKRLIQTLKFTSVDADKIMDVYETPIQLRIDVMADKELPFSKTINEKLEKYYGGTGLGFDSDERPEIKDLKKRGLLDEKGRPTIKMPKRQAGKRTEEK